MIFLLFASQSTGVLGIGNYAVLVYQNLGFSGSIPLLMNAAYTCLGTLMTVVSSFIMDKIGRRKMFCESSPIPNLDQIISNFLVIGFPATGVCLLIEALLTRQYAGETSNKAGNAAAVAIFFLYITIYDTFIDPPSFVWCSEIWPTSIRAKGIALAFCTYFIGALTYTTPAAVASGNIGWKFYMVFLACNCVSTVIVYLFLPETTGKSMEEMGDLFGDEVMVHMTADGQGIIEMNKLEGLGVGEHIDNIEVVEQLPV